VYHTILLHVVQKWHFFKEKEPSLVLVVMGKSYTDFLRRYLCSQSLLRCTLSYARNPLYSIGS